MSITLAKRHATDEYGEHWTLTGPRGAVTLLRGLSTGIELHSRAPWPGGSAEPPSTTCPFVAGPVYCEGRRDPGVQLLKRYRDSGDVDTIWAELERVYADLPEATA